jgi:hypothetical protein
MSKTKTLDRLSGYSFFLGTLAAKMQYLPKTVLSPILNLAALGLYLSGYTLWFIASRFYPEHFPKYTEWYGFAPTKEQSSYAAAVGISAVLISIAALALPVLIVPATWLFFASNLFWVISEYHKLNNPAPDEDFSQSYQESYLSYAITMSTMNLVGALTATLILIFPPLALPLLVASSLISVGLTITAIGYWLEFNYGEHEKTPVIETSHDKISQNLRPSLQVTDKPSLEPYHGKGLFQKTPSEEEGIELVAIPQDKCATF